MGRKRKYATDDEARIARNARRCLARAADPTYRERHLKYQRTFDRKHKVSERLRKLTWKHANPDQKKVNRQRRRARIANASGWHSTSQIRAIRKAQNHHCAYCDVTENLHLDHCIPLSRGGSNWPWNLQWLCAHHNISKLDKTDAEYRCQIGLPIVPWLSAILWAAALAIPVWVLTENLIKSIIDLNASWAVTPRFPVTPSEKPVTPH